MTIIDKIVYLEIFFPTHQKLTQSDIGIKRYGQNTETCFQKNSASVRMLMPIFGIQMLTVAKPSIRTITIYVRTLRPVTVF